MRLQGRRVVITGAGSGFGRATAKLFAAEGAAMALLDIDETAARATAEMAGGQVYGVDVTDEAQVRDAITAAEAAMGGIDGIVNSAGIMSAATLEETDAATWRRVLEINLTGPYLICRAALGALRAAERATIVTIASGQALLPSLRGCSYAASKAGVMMFTKSLAVELAPRIRANVVCPGASDTPMTQRILPASQVEAREALKAGYAMKRLTEPEEVAQAILFLTSDAASAITGVALAVDCGRTYH